MQSINCEHHRDLCKELYHPEPPMIATPEPNMFWILFLVFIFAIGYAAFTGKLTNKK